MEKKNGFTLIELLAVIIILGILMIIAIPSVTRYINDSRKSAYIDTAKEIISGARNVVNEGKLGIYDTNTTYYIPASCIQTENGTKSPYGEFTKAYVGVIYNGTGYKYYWISVDDAGQGVANITPLDKLDTDNIVSDLTDSDIENVVESTGIGDRSEIKILNCSNNSNTWDREHHIDDTSNNIPEDGSNSGENNAIVYPTGKTKETVESGDIVTIGTEEFYVVRHDGDDLILLAHYNLKVGYIYGSSLIGEYTSEDEGYGIQSSEVRGVLSGNSNSNGTLAFSTTNYWGGKVGTDYPGIYCNYSNSNAYVPGANCAYVYDSNSILYQYVQNYKTYLSRLGARIKEARLMSLDESGYFRSINYSAWNETSYWLGTVRDNDTGRIWGVTNPSGFVHGYYMATPKTYGVRPVIVI